MSNKKQTYLSPMISVCDMNDFKLLTSSDGSGTTGGVRSGDMNNDNSAKSNGNIDMTYNNDDNTSSNNNSLWYDEENN